MKTVDQNLIANVPWLYKELLSWNWQEGKKQDWACEHETMKEENTGNRFQNISIINWSLPKITSCFPDRFCQAELASDANAGVFKKMIIIFPLTNSWLNGDSP